MAKNRIALGLAMLLVALRSEASGDRASRLDVLRNAGTAVRTLDFFEDTIVTDERDGKVLASPVTTVHLLYRADLALLRVEGTTESATAFMGHECRNGGGAPTVRRITQSVPAPAWLYHLPELLARARCRTRAEGDGRVIAVHGMRSDQPETPRSQAEVTLNRTGLPASVVTFGANHEVLDEILIQWQRRDGVDVPLKVTYRYHSARNLLTSEVTCRGMRVNAAIGASLFEAP